MSVAFFRGVGGKIEYGLSWMTCSVVLVVTAMHMLSNEIDVTDSPDKRCFERCKAGGKEGSSPAREPTEEKWNYGYGRDDGPHVWPSKSKLCGGRHQSPVDLDTTTSLTRYSPHLYWWNYHRLPRHMRLLNNGHSVMLRGEWSIPSEMPSFWPSTGNYSETEENLVFEQLHFHWGSNYSVGSEHAINSVRYPLEMHVVHRKRKFKDLAHALDAGEGNVLVVAVLFQISSHNNEALAPIISHFRRITEAGSEIEVGPFELRRLLPEFSNYFLMYNGSLTSPPCNEGVTWVVKMEVSTVSIEQLAEFHRLMTEKRESLIQNYRPLQPLNGRHVWHVK